MPGLPAPLHNGMRGDVDVEPLRKMLDTLVADGN